MSPGADGRILWSGALGNWLLLALSVGVALVLGEVVARVVLPRPLPWLYPQLRYRSDPTLIFALVPEQRAFSADKAVRINERGLRGPVIPYQQTPGKLRLLFLGDSIVFGYGVHEEESVPMRVASLLEAKGVNAEAVNSGVPAYNTGQEVDFLNSAGIAYRPDWVIVGACWNDINEQSSVRVTPEGWLVSGNDQKRGLLARLGESEMGYEIRNALKRSRIIYAGMTGVRSLLGLLFSDDHEVFRMELLEGRDTPRVAQGWREVAGALHRVKELAGEQGFRVLVVAFPVPLALERAFPMSGYPRGFQRIVEREGLQFLNLEPYFRKAQHGQDSLFIPYDGDHPNAAGHQLAASEIVRVLLSSGALAPAPCANSSRPAQASGGASE